MENKDTQTEKKLDLRSVATFAAAILIILLGYLAWTHFVPNVGGNGAEAVMSLDDVLAEAQDENKPVLVYLYRDGLGAYEYNTFRDDQVAPLLSGFVLLKAPLISDARYLNEYEVTITPTWLFLTPEGQEIDRGEGALSPNFVAEIMENVLARPVPFRDLELLVADEASTNYAGMVRLAQIYDDRGETTAAVATAERVLQSDLPETDPLRAKAMLTQGAIYTSTGEFRKGVDLFLSYRSLFPESEKTDEVLFGLLLCQLSLDRSSAGAQTYKELITAHPESPYAQEALYMYLLQYRISALGDFDRTVSEIKTYLAENPDSVLAPHAKFALARIYCSRPETAHQGLALLKELYTDPGTDPELALKAQDVMITTAVRESNIPFAILELQSLLDSELPNKDMISYKLASLYQQYQQPERAMELLRTVAEKYPDSYLADDALHSLGLIHLQVTQDFGKALESFNEAIARYPRSDAAALSKYHSAFALYSSKRFDETSAFINRILAGEPEDSDLAVGLREIKEHLANNRDYGDAPLSLYVEAKLAAQKDDYREAFDLYQRILEEYPGSNVCDDALVGQAELYLNQARNFLAQSELNSALAKMEEVETLLERAEEDYPAGDKAENVQDLLNQIRGFRRRVGR